MSVSVPFIPQQTAEVIHARHYKTESGFGPELAALIQDLHICGVEQLNVSVHENRELCLFHNSLKKFESLNELPLVVFMCPL